MNILKVLQKKQKEQVSKIELIDDFVSSNKIARISKNKPPDFFIDQHSEDRKSKLAQDITKSSSALEKENADKAILDVYDLTRSSEKKLPEFFCLNIDPDRVNLRLAAITDPNSSYCEIYRDLRTQVLHKSQRQKLQSIVVASINPSEGKSITTLNLSWLLAQTDGINALIIDSDLRMPSLTDYLGIEADKGLSDILAGEALLSDTIIKLQPSGLHLIPGGKFRSGVAELISGPMYIEILRQAREMFDYVIIDAPPLKNFTDASVLINIADGALLVVRANHTDYKDVRRIMETLPPEKMLGGVLNQASEVLGESYYDYNYYKKNERQLTLFTDSK